MRTPERSWTLLGLRRSQKPFVSCSGNLWSSKKQNHRIFLRCNEMRHHFLVPKDAGCRLFDNWTHQCRQQPTSFVNAESNASHFMNVCTVLTNVHHLDYPSNVRRTQRKPNERIDNPQWKAPRKLMLCRISLSSLCSYLKTEEQILRPEIYLGQRFVLILLIWITGRPIPDMTGAQNPPFQSVRQWKR